MKQKRKTAPDKNMEKNSPPFRWIWLLPEAAALLTALLGVYGIGMYRQTLREELLRNLVMAALGIGVTGFLLRRDCMEHALDYDNGENLQRFWWCFLVCLPVALAGVFLPAAGLPFLVIFVALTLFSNLSTGVVSAAMLLMLTVLVGAGQWNVFLLYFVSGVVAASFFHGLDKSFRIGVPLLLSLMVLMVCETANLVLFDNRHLNGEMFVIPAANVIVSGILLLGVCKLVSSAVIYRYRVKYMELTDPECALLVRFKEEAREEYYQSMHTAYFCDRIGRRLGLDADALKAAGYYHRIDRALGVDTAFEQVDVLLEKYRFPPAVRAILKEFLAKGRPIRGKETAVLVFADAVTASVMFLFSQDKSAVPDYDKLIDAIFRKQLNAGVLRECEITQRELTIMKKIFKEEKLYYDFLR